MRIARATERSKAVRRGVRLRRVSWTRTAARRYSDRAPPATSRLGHADVAQLVEHHLAKVRVAGSSPVVRSERSWPHPLTTRLRGGGRLFTRWSGREARQRTANPYTRVQIPSPPRAAGAVVARFPDTEEVTGSNPVSPTRTIPGTRRGSSFSGRLLLPCVGRPSLMDGGWTPGPPGRARPFLFPPDPCPARNVSSGPPPLLPSGRRPRRPGPLPSSEPPRGPGLVPPCPAGRTGGEDGCGWRTAVRHPQDGRRRDGTSRRSRRPSAHSGCEMQ